MDKAHRLISFNQLKTWSRCRKKYALDYVSQLHWPSDQRHFQFGQDIHKLLDYQSHGFSCDHLIAQASPEIRQAWGRLMADPITRLPVLGSEWGFCIPIRGCWLVGRADRIAKEGNYVRVIDWKTGTAVPKNPTQDWQTIVYLYAVYEARHELGLADLLPDALQFTYVEVRDQIRTITIPYDLEQHQKAKQLLEETIQSIQSAKTYPLPSQCPDRFCPYGEICGINTTRQYGSSSIAAS